jgi:hypothetical protein
MSSSARTRNRVVGYILGILLIAVALVAVSPPQSSRAALSGSDFVPGNIISDAEFYDSSAMSEADIQSFLSAKEGSCGNANCLSDLVTTVASRGVVISPYGNGVRCNAFTGGTLSAAQIIYNAQVACGLSAKVILVTLQKEQGLVTATAPSVGALSAAMGYDCPDTAPCAPTTLGFGNQVYTAALQLVTYKIDKVGLQPGVHNVLYSYLAGCAAPAINIQNYATAALYTYTPYQPDPTVLAGPLAVKDTCASYGNYNFWVYYNTWFGAEATVPPTTINTPAAGEPADYILATDGSGGMWMYPTVGGTFGARTQVGSGWDTMIQVITDGDFNGDGHPDVIAEDNTGKLWMYPRDGSGGWLARVLIGSGWDVMSAILGVGDFNGDGHSDIIARRADGTLFLYPGDGHGGFLPSIVLGGGWQGLTITAAGDFNGDGHPDLIVRDANGTMWLYPGNGKDGFLPRVQLATGWGSFTSIVGPVDFNGDGHMDVLVRDSNGLLWEYPGNGLGALGTPVEVGSGWQGFTTIDVEGGVAITPPPPGAGVGDFNGDGNPDVVVRDANGVLWLYPGNGKNGFLPRVQLATGWQDFSGIEGVGDFTGDGHPDVIARDSSGVLWLYPGNGSNGFLPRVQLATGWQGMTAISGAADMNGDGHLDLIARDSSGTLWLYPGTGAGALGTPVQLATGMSSMTAIIGAGDFNGDGNADVIARDASGALWLYPGDGHGALGARVQIGGGWQGLTVLAAGDFNRDGTQDLIVRDANGGLWLYPGNGKGGFLARVQIGGGWQGLAIAGDGNTF